jgi:hypothetical protein
MLTEPVGDGMPGSRAAATPQIEEPRCVEPNPTHPRS